MLTEVQILKNVRHPNLEMNLGITYTCSIFEENDKKISTYKFYMVTENTEEQNQTKSYTL